MSVGEGDWLCERVYTKDWGRDYHHALDPTQGVNCRRAVAQNSALNLLVMVLFSRVLCLVSGLPWPFRAPNPSDLVGSLDQYPKLEPRAADRGPASFCSPWMFKGAFR